MSGTPMSIEGYARSGARRLRNAIGVFRQSRTAAALAHVHDVAAVDGTPVDTADLFSPDAFTDDLLIEFYAQAEYEKQRAAAAFDWAAKAAAAEIERRLHARRAERGGDATIEIPHPRVEVILEAQYSAYQFDVEQAREAVRGLPEDVAAKLVIVTPAHTIPARTIPEEHVEESVRCGPVASWKAALSRFSGSAHAQLIERAFTRQRLSDRVIIRPRKGASK